MRSPLNIISQALASSISELVKLKQDHPDVDLVTVLSEPDVNYNNFVLALDEIKFTHEGDPPVEREMEDSEKG